MSDSELIRMELGQRVVDGFMFSDVLLMSDREFARLYA